MTLTTRTTLTALGPDGFAVGKNATVTLERGVSYFNNYASRGKKNLKKLQLLKKFDIVQTVLQVTFSLAFFIHIEKQTIFLIKQHIVP